MFSQQQLALHFTFPPHSRTIHYPTNTHSWSIPEVFTKILPICKGPAQGQNIQRLCGEDVTGTQRAQQHVLRVMNSLFSFVPLKTTNVVETIINYPFGNGLYHLFVVIWGMVCYCFNHIVPTCMFIAILCGCHNPWQSLCQDAMANRLNQSRPQNSNSRPKKNGNVNADQNRGKR